MDAKKIIFGVLSTIAILTVVWFTLSFTTQNKEVNIRGQIIGQQKKCKTHHANMRNILIGKAEVTDQYKEAFEKIFPDMIAGRYSKGDGSLMKFISENNPDFKIDLYKDLMQSIAIERTAFINEQDILIDLQREHYSLLHNKPYKWFLDDSVKDIEIQIVSSTASEEAFSSGKDDDVKLFDKKDKQ